jgi:hypothetical protein
VRFAGVHAGGDSGNDVGVQASACLANGKSLMEIRRSGFIPPCCQWHLKKPTMHDFVNVLRHDTNDRRN